MEKEYIISLLWETTSVLRTTPAVRAYLPPNTNERASLNPSQ